ncbi:GNAT family N-acetyltransferase [Tessaracoccus lubricantis]|uniref:GNAT family N-acetyltransferase n=1 Tax=Tessaracoccus lubricantis TaxID=545543 RepID=A0ABP9FAL6_9ACTN
MIPLQTERLLLRAFTDDDLEFVFQLHQNPDLVRFIRTATTPDLETARRHLDKFMTLRDHPVHGFSVVELRTGPHAGTAVGIIMVKPIPPSGGGEATDTEIGWRQVAEHTGNGYITEAAAAALAAVLETGLPEVVAVTHPDNHASQRVCERIGMRRIGLTDAYYDTQTLLFRTTRA